MQVQKLNNSVYSNQNSAVNPHKENNAATNTVNYPHMTVQSDSVAFKGGAGNFAKRGKHILRQLFEYMKNPSEMTNAAIAAIGTGAIAPFAIMCSPGKKATSVEDEKAAREKKKFQAMRQPVSALLAFGFQVPTTIGIAKGLNKLAYEKHIKLFDDEVLGQLIPDKKYLTKQARKVLDGKADVLTQREWAEELKILDNPEKITEGLIKQLRKGYDEDGIVIAEEELQKLANDKGRRLKYVAEEMANTKHNGLVNAKVKELSGKEFKITDLDLVTEKYQKLAKEVRYPEEFAALRKDAKLTWFDKALELIGFSNKKLSKLEKAEKALAQEKGLAIMQEDIANGKIADVFKDKNARLKKFIENRIGKSQKLYGNKIFWLSLVTNLFMVAISCVALNWLHPKFANMIESIQHKKDAQNPDKKVEVRA